MPIGPLGALGQQAHGIAPNLGPMNDPNDINTLDPAINPQFQTLDPMQMLDVDKDVVPSTPPNQVTPQEQAIIGYLTAQPIAYQTPEMDPTPQFDEHGWLTTPPQTPQDMIDQDFAAIYGIPDKTFMEQQAVQAIGKAMPFQSLMNDRSLPQLGPEDPDTAPVGVDKGMPANVSQFSAPLGYQQAAPTQAEALADALGYANSQAADTGYGYGLSLGAADSGISGFGIGSVGAPGQGTDGGYGFGAEGMGIGLGSEGGYGLGDSPGSALGGGAGVSGQGFGAPGMGGEGFGSVGAPGSGTSDGFGAGATGVAGVSEGGALGGGIGIGGLGGGIGDGTASGTGSTGGDGTGDGAGGGGVGEGGEGGEGGGGAGW